MSNRHLAITAAFLALGQLLVASSMQAGSSASERAVEKARSLLGLAAASAAISITDSTLVSEVALSDSVVRVWTGVDTTLRVFKIVLRDVRLTGSRYHPEGQKELSRDFEVYVDSANDVVYRIVSRSVFYDSAVIRKPSPFTVQSRVIFQSQLPAVPLLSALDRAASNPFEAMEIDAALVMGRYGSDSLKPVWEIHMYGVEHPGSRRGKDRPIYQRNHCMSVIDAVSGEFLLGTN